MKLRTENLQKYGVLISVLFFVLVGGSSMYYLYTRAHIPFKTIEKAIEQVRTETEVIETFGNPDRTVHKGTEDYYVDGYSFKKREISNKVLIYFPKNPTDVVADLILYVYIDEKGQVEDYFVGGS